MRVVLQRDCMLSVLVISIGILFLIQQDLGLFHVDLEVQEAKNGKTPSEQHDKEKSNNTVHFTANTRAVFLDVFIYREKVHKSNLAPKLKTIQSLFCICTENLSAFR